MVKPELGTKRTCPNCSARFYDLAKDPIECPKCGYSFVAESLLPSKMEQQAAVAPVSKVEPEVEEEAEDIELVSLEDVEEDTKDEEEEEVPPIEDVEIEDDPIIKTDDEDAFLEEDEDNPDVTGIIGGVADEDDEV